jgi:hypothetical protein
VSSLTLFLVAALSFAFGAVAGGLIFTRLSPEQKKSRELEKHLHTKQDEIKSYQHDVKQHFQETSFLLKQLAENYREVHNHLAQGASDLCTDNPNDPMIKKLPEMQVLEVNSSFTHAQAPLDYAPKSTPYDKSALSEDYGLEKIKHHEDISNDIADAIAEQAAKQHKR